MDFLSFSLIILVGAPSISAAGQIGAACDEDPQKKKPPCTVPNTFCVNGICMCAPLYQHVGNECVLKSSKTLGVKCKGSTECTGKGEYCSSKGKCSCLSTHLILGGNCKPVIYPGQSGCEDSRQCAEGYPGAVCTSQKKCQCPNGFEAKAFSCFKMEIAQQNISAMVEKQYLPQRKRLRPFRASVNDYSNFAQVAKYIAFSNILPGEPCVADQDCSGYPLAYCDGRCQCSQNAVNTGSTCSSRKNMHGSSVTSSCSTEQTYVQEAGSCMITQQPGKPCQYSQQCEAVESGSFCKNSRCHCAQGMKLIGNSCAFADRKCTVRGYIWVPEVGECMQVLSPSANGCSHSVQCSAAVNGTYCYRHVCTCPAGLVPTDGTCGKQCQAGQIFSAVTGQCIPTVKPGGQCQYSSQCQAENAEMICDRSVCRCSSGKVFMGNGCAESCPPDHIVGSNGICRQGCSSTQIEHDGECYNQVPAGQNCIMNSQCMGGTSCVNGICICPSSMTIRGGSCRQKEVAPLESCAHGEVCLGGSYCSTGICVCPTGSSILNEECVQHRTVPPNSPCNPAVQCGGGSSCIANVCQCPNAQQPVNGVCKVPSSVTAGGPCPTGFERCLGGSSCVRGICECPFGTVPESGECVSMRKVSAGSLCSATQICVGIASCIDGICQCPAGTVVQDGHCRSSTLVGPGASCAAGEVCSGGSVCTKSICLCPTGTINENGIICSAARKKKPEEACLYGEECSDDLLCIDGVCQCPRGTLSSGGRCVAATDSVGECSDSSQCAGGSYCDHESGLCICPGGHELRDRSCVPTFTRALTLPTKRCITSVDCIAGAKCINNRCHCPAGEIFVDGRCQMIFAESGESCSNGETCVTNHVCISGICSCPDGEVSRNGNCITKTVDVKRYTNHQAEPNAPCNRGEICTGGSYCDVKNGLCRCPADTILRNGNCDFSDDLSLFTLPPLLVFNRSADVPGKLLNHTMFNITRVTLRTNRCESDDDCKGGSYCLSYRCICPFNMIMKDGFCQRMFPFSRERVGHLGGRCTTNYTCIARNTACQNGVCVCLPGHRIFGSTECIPKTAPFYMTRPQTTITTATMSTSNNIMNGSEITEMATNEALASGPEFGPDGTSLDSATFTALPLIDTGMGRHSLSSKQTEIIVNISGGVCNETTLCLFFSICHNGVCKCPFGTRISDTECKFVVDVSRLRQFEKLLRGDYSALALATRSTIPVYGYTSRTTPVTLATTVPPAVTRIRPSRTTADWFWSTEEPWPAPRPRSELKPVPTVVPLSVVNISPPGTYCDNEEYYCSNGSVCIENQCVCRPGHVLVDGACVARIYVRRCTTSRECPSGARCVDGLCSCMSSFAMSRYGFCIPFSSESGPGMPCTNGETCTGYSECVRGICTCPPDRSYIVDNECVETIRGLRTIRSIKQNTIGLDEIPLGDYCTVQQSNQCAGGGICIRGRCGCPFGSSQRGQLCVGTDQALPGDRCWEGKSCVSSYCSNGICACYSGYHLRNGECVKSLTFSKRLKNNCTNDPTVCRDGTYCLKGVCVCPAGHVCTPNQKSDTPQQHLKYSQDYVAFQQGQSVSPGGPCDENDVQMQCSGNSICANGFCTCPSGERIVNGVCIALDLQGAPGDVCEAGYTTCTGGSMCVDNYCKCLSNQVAINGQCTVQYRPVFPNQACIGKAMCTGGSICVQGICVCPTGMYAPSGAPVCRPAASFYSNTVITISSAPGERCVPTPNGQLPCRGGAMCVNQLCVCPQGNVVSGSSCVPVGNIAAASGSWTCRGVVCGSGSVCVEGNCRCAQGTVLVNGQCVPNFRALQPSVKVSAPGERCSTSEEGPVCSDNAICVNEVCVCPADRVIAGNKCVQFRGHAAAGGSCLTEGIICGGGSICVAGICQCPAGTASSNGQCIISNSSPPVTPILEPGARCIPLCSTCAQCGGGSVCLVGQCTCPLGQFAFRSRCYPVKPPNILGLRDEERQPVTPNTAPTPTVMVRPGDRCNSTAICGGGSSCIIGKCVCSPGYVPNKGRNSCTSVLLNPQSASANSNPGESCTSLTVCSGGSTCLGGICTCPVNSYLLNKVCVYRDAPKALYAGSACAMTDFCQRGSSCYRGYCVCLGDTVTNAAGECIQTRLVSQPGLAGSRCGTLMEAQCAPSLECTSWGYCVCPSGYEGNGIGKCSPTRLSKSSSGIQFRKLSKASCKTSADCKMDKVCIGGSCGCPVGTVLRNDKCIFETTSERSNYLTVQKKTKCTTSTDCKSNFVCEQGSCICPQETHQAANGSACIQTKKSVAPGSWCDVNSGVICNGGSRCYKSSCVCPYGHLISALQCIPAPNVLPGASCMNGEVCVGGSLCMEGKCTCPVGTATAGGNVCERRHYRFARSLTGQPEYSRKVIATTPETIFSWQSLEECPVSGSCRLPDCFCSRSGLEVPGGLLASDIPQIILLSFDGPVTDPAFTVYKSLFSGKYRNPNGCAIKATFFVSNDWNNYDQTQWLMSDGHEVAVNSISHRTLGNETMERWKKEMVGMRDALLHFSYATAASITGVRAPQLELGGDNQFDMMEKSGFVFDNTMSVSGGPYWPQTLAYETAWKCSSRYCPRRAHPNVWEIPINRFAVTGSQNEFTMLKEAVRRDDSPLDVAEMLELNLNRSYHYNRAPYLLTIDNDFLNVLPNKGAVTALELFIEKALRYSDIYFVTATQALDWIRRPTRSLNIHNFASWQCNNVPGKGSVRPCENPSSCSFTCDGEARVLRICGTCPRVYPKLGDPTGTGNSTDDRYL